jgi:hypothetical protein
MITRSKMSARAALAWPFLIPMVVLPALVLPALVLPAVAQATVPQAVSFQGYLRNDDGTPLEGTVDLTFKIYAAANGGAPLWTENHGAVAISEGVFHVHLGSITAFPADFFSVSDRWIETVADGATLVPRQAFTSTPYALRAAVAEVALNGAGDPLWDEAAGNVYRPSGNVGVGTTTPQEKLHVTDGLFARLRLERTGGSTVQTDASGSGGAVGTISNHHFRLLTNNTVRLHVEPTGNVGIGTVSPARKLDVSGEAEADAFMATTSLGATATPPSGGVYVDNVVYGWGRIRGDALIEQSYGIESVTRLGAGHYRVIFKKSLPNGAIPIATAYSANDVVVARVASVGTDRCEVKLDLWCAGCPGGFVATDYRFLVMVTGRP